MTSKAERTRQKRASRKISPVAPRHAPAQNQRVTVVIFMPRPLQQPRIGTGQPRAIPGDGQPFLDPDIDDAQRAGQLSPLPQQMARARALESHCQRGGGQRSSRQLVAAQHPAAVGVKPAEDVDGDDLAAPIYRHAQHPGDFRIQRPRQPGAEQRIDA